MARWMVRHPFTVDALIAATAFAALLVDVAYAGPTGGARLAAVVFAAVMAGSLAWRRRAPLASYAAGTVALALQAVVVYTSELYPYVNLLGIYSAALYATRRRGQVALAVGLGGVVAFFSAYDTDAVMLPLLIALVWSAAWAAGYVVARRREEAAVAVRDAALDERRRIARELHDLIGHTVNVMVVQAGAARRVLDGDPERARTALETLERIGRGALDELDRVLGILRDDAPAAEVELHPPTGLADVEALAERFTQAGLTVTTAVDGTPPPDVPRSLDVSAYRIVQEALTNTLKHARASHASVHVRHVEGAVEIEVRDDGVGGGAATGRGITGMAERVALFGGRLEHGGGDGGYRIRAVLPLESPAHPPPPVPSP